MIDIKNLNVSFDDLDVLKDISFNLPKGSFLNIIGPNGGGKSTLIKTIVGLNKPNSGSIVINSKKIGYMPQRLLMKANFPITVSEVLSISNKTNNNFQDVINSLKIDKIINSQMKNLSGGEQQRVYLARALMSNPDILVLDEAFSALDQNFRHEFFHIIQDLNKKGITIIHVTHDLNDINHINSYVLWLDQEIIFYGSYDEYLRMVGA